MVNCDCIDLSVRSGHEFEQSLNYLVKFFRAKAPQASAQAFGGQRPNLRDLDPGRLGSFALSSFSAQGRLTCGWLVMASAMTVPDAFVKQIVADDKDRPFPRLLSGPTVGRDRPRYISPSVFGPRGFT